MSIDGQRVSMASGRSTGQRQRGAALGRGSATMLRQWHFGGLGPDAAMFAGDTGSSPVQGRGLSLSHVALPALAVIRELVAKGSHAP